MPRNPLVRSLLILVCAAIALFTAPLAASADSVTNSVGANTAIRIPVGTSVTVSYRLLQRNKDGQKGCNASANSPATLTITAPAQVTVIPASKQLIFKSCRQSQQATFTVDSQGGPFPVSVTVTSSSPGTYDATSAGFTLFGLPPADVDAPALTVHFPASNGLNGWFVSKPVIGIVTATDPNTVTSIECVGASTTNVRGLGSAVASADLVVAAEGPTYVSCQATDGAMPTPNSGFAPGSVFSADIEIDTAAPAVTPDVDRAPDSNGWYNHSVTVSFQGEDESSGIDVCDDPVAYSGPDRANVTITGACSDLAGNQAAQGSADLSYDATPPVHVAAAADRPADFYGGYRRSVTIAFSGADAVSGAAPGSLSCTSITYTGPATPRATVTGACTDPAGNTSPSAGYNFKFFAMQSLPLLCR